MKTLQEKIIEAYIPGETTLREVARMCETDHHQVKRALIKTGISVVKGKIPPPTQEHRDKISKACKGRKVWNKGKKAFIDSLRKNMQAHLRFDVSIEYLRQFSDIEKLKTLNSCISKRSRRYDVGTDWYIAYIDKFYNDLKFNMVYTNWELHGRNPYMRPSLDHIVPKAKGGTNDIDNLQFLTWFENRCKNDMTQQEWDKVKKNLNLYFV